MWQNLGPTLFVCCIWVRMPPVLPRQHHGFAKTTPRFGGKINVFKTFSILLPLLYFPLILLTKYDEMKTHH